MIARAIAAAAAVAACLASGCTSYQSRYVRTSAAPGELVWRYDNRLQVTRNGQLVAESGSWSELPDVVACVPRAGELARSARSRHRTGSVWLWTGLAGMITGVAAGTAFALSNTDDTGKLLTGLGVMGAGLGFGLITLPVGGYLRATANTRGIDAVNIYNDNYTSAACAR